MEETWFMAVQENSIVLFGEWKGINQRGLILASNSCCSSCCHCDVQTHWKQKLIVTMEATALIKPTPVNVTAVTYLFPTTLEKLFRGMKHPQIAHHWSKIKKTTKLFWCQLCVWWFLGQVLQRAAVFLEKKSRRLLELWTNAPSTQFYRANNMKGGKGKRGYVYNSRAGLCLVTRGFPDAVNNPNSPSQIVTRAKPSTHPMLFKFKTSP